MCNKICKEINMVSVKRVLSGILVLTISILIGCSKVKEDNEVTLDLFDVFRGKDLATNYLINIRNGDIEKANEVCVKELVENNIFGIDKYICLFLRIWVSRRGYYTNLRISLG